MSISFANCTDAQCTAGANGRCNEVGVAVATCACTYDACASDADCSQGQTCACHGSPYTVGTGNMCVAGNCRVDADCGANGYCSPSPAANGCGGIPVGGYYCHTQGDECVDDSDCHGSAGIQGCAYSTTSNRWTCIPLPLCA
jgi:hypothetical protein